MSVFGFGFGGAFDENLDNKINEVLSGSKSLADRNASFLKDLGVKPENLPMPEQDARKFFGLDGAYPETLLRLIGGHLPDLPEDNVTIEVRGSSLGLTEVAVSGQDFEENDLSHTFHDGDPEWPQLERAWKTLKTTDLSPRFTITWDSETYAWKASAEPLPTTTWHQVTEGMVLRLAKPADPDQDDIYISIWQQSPLVCLNLATMQQVEDIDTGGWVIVEAIGG